MKLRPYQRATYIARIFTLPWQRLSWRSGKIHTYFQGTIHKSSTAGRIMNQFAGIMNNM